MAKSKTIWFAILLAAFGAAQANLGAVQGVITPEMFGWLNVIFGVIVASLRVVTTKPLSEK